MRNASVVRHLRDTGGMIISLFNYMTDYHINPSYLITIVHNTMNTKNTMGIV